MFQYYPVSYTHLDVYKRQVSCVALGTGKALENLDALDGKGKR